MDHDAIGALWAGYKARDLVRTIHPADTMNMGPGAKFYWEIGESAVRLICTGLTTTWKRDVQSVLDFGCGHGRVARHLRAFFRDARLCLCERAPGAAAFCAEAFAGEVVNEEALPGNLDVIWVGSVFTHLNASAMRLLFDKLAARLSQQGILVATFHGRKAILIKQAAKETYIGAEKWAAILGDYERTGMGYADYDNMPGYGVSLTSPARVMKLGETDPRLRLTGYIEAGWAEHQDVAIWCANPLKPA